MDTSTDDPRRSGEGARDTPSDGINLRSGLWIDEPDVEERIALRAENGELTEDQVRALTDFARDGFLVIEPGIGEEEARSVEAEITDLWRQRPADVAYAYDGPARSMRHADEERERRKRYRIHDPHSHGEQIRKLYLLPAIHRWMNLLVGEPAVAIQSLYFQYGSEQVLHRDPVVVPTGAPGHLFAAWIALEDISASSGALVYVPGSHRLPYYEFAPGDYRFDGSCMGAAEIEAATAFDDEQARRHGLEPQIFTAQCGQVLIWHANLRHGGTPVTDPSATRRSLVVHFSTRRTYTERAITIAEPEAEGDRPVVLSTRELIEHDGCYGFESPMAGYLPRDGA